MTQATKQTSFKMRLRILKTAAELADIAARPGTPDDVKTEIYKTVQALRKRYGFTDDVKREEMLRLMSLGASSIRDIINETGFDRDDVYKIIEDLETEGSIVRRFIPPASGGAGRPMMLFFMKNTRPE